MQPVGVAPDRSGPRLVLGLVGLVTLLTAVCLYVRLAVPGGSLSPEAAANAFLDETGADGIQSAYDSTTTAFRRAQSLEQFRIFVARQPILARPGPGSRRTIEIVAPPGPAAEDAPVLLRIRVQDAKGSVMLTMTLRKEGGLWKVDSLTLP